MKKLYLFAFLIYHFPLLQAQLNFGVKFSVLATDVNVKADNSLNSIDFPTARKLSYDGGVILEYEFLPDFLGIRTGLDYAQKGYNVNLDQLKEKYSDIKNIEGDWTVALQYLQMPVSMYYKIGNFNINAGPYLAYALGGKEKYDMEVLYDDGTKELFEGNEDIIPVSGEADVDLEDQGETLLINYINELDYGLNLGVGFSIKKFQINVQYQQGLKNLTPDLLKENNFKPSDFITKNNVISIDLVYFFIGHNKNSRDSYNQF